MIDERVMLPAQFAQIDVQGVELKVLQSFGKWLGHLLCTVVEVSKMPQYKGSDFEPETAEFLKTRGFVEISGMNTSQRAWFDEVLYARMDWVSRPGGVGRDIRRARRI